MELNIPAGYIHRSELIAQGWTSSMITETLTDIVKIEAPEGTSNKAYSITEAEAAAASNAKIRKAIQAKADLIPAAAEESIWENTISQTSLLERGWTASLITRYLGKEADLLGGGPYNNAKRYNKTRVTTAETTAPDLIKRLAKKEAARIKEMEAAVEAGKIIYRKDETHGWVVQGKNLTPDAVVVVTLKDGSTKTEKVGEILTQAGDVTVAQIA